MLFVGAARSVGDVAEGDGGVLPVDLAVAVAVAGDDDRRVREGFGGVDGGGGGAVCPLAGGEAGCGVAFAAHGLAPQAAVLPGGSGGAVGLVVAGVGLDGAAEPGGG